MQYVRPHGVIAGFHADAPDETVPELLALGEQWFPRQREIGVHAHHAWELYLQLDGVSRWRSARGGVQLGPGDMYAAPPDVEHRLVDSSTRKHHFVFAIVDLDAVFARLPGLAGPWRKGSFLRIENAEAIEPPFRQLVREVTMAQPHRAEGLRAALDTVVIEATRLLEAAAGARRGDPLIPMHPAVTKAKHLIESHPEQAWRLIELGRLVGMSPNHLVNLFTHEVGVSPRQYLLRQRIERAKHQLATSDAAITAIALDLGFSSSQHFAKSFTAIAGCSASTWREQKHGKKTPRLR